MYPKPVQQPHPPIHVGGESNAALRRAARHGDGWYSFNRLPDALDEPLARLDALLGRRGPQPAATSSSRCRPYFNPVDAAAIEAYQEHGVDRLVVLCLAFDVDGLRAQLDDLVANVLEPARA